jgi:hypothetical protein
MRSFGLWSVALAAGLTAVIMAVSAAACAPQCKNKKAKWVFCSGGAEIISAAVRAPNGNPIILDSKIGGVEVEIKCTSGSYEPTLEKEGRLIGSDRFENCTVPKPAGECAISEKKITLNPMNSALEGPVPGGPPEIKLEGA